jgi:hypothetical protein
MAMGSRFRGHAFMQQFFSRITIILGLTVITSIMIVLLMIAGYVGIYFGLVHYGLAPLVSALTTVGFAGLVTGILARATYNRVLQLRTMHTDLFESPFVSNFQDLLTAFLEGFAGGR